VIFSGSFRGCTFIKQLQDIQKWGGKISSDEFCGFLTGFCPDVRFWEEKHCLLPVKAAIINGNLAF
jgi:hypothetical protein